MFFNSIEFFIFLPIVFSLYWLIGAANIKRQNLLILLASYFFYGWWDIRFLGLIAFSSLVDFFIGINLEKSDNEKQRKKLLTLSLLTNLGLLLVFKYYNFFADSLIESFTFFNAQLSLPSLNIILPVGISFYTFQTLSYTIDIYRRKLKPTKSIINFSAFVSFFPQLVAGPIERATNLLPQFSKQRSFDYKLAKDGLRQALWGLFKKVVIADNCAIYVNEIFGNHETLAASTLVLGAVYFAFQIYCDFSGYSDIAIGTAKLFGFKLMTNFKLPYFSRDIAEFWRRWHISLSTWFRDYLYIPLGGSRKGKAMAIRNIFAIFIVSGFWHGANFTFIIWGALNAIYYLPIFILNKNRNNLNQVAESSFLPTFKELLMMLITFSLVTFSWIFFRADNLQHAVAYITNICNTSIFTMPIYLRYLPNIAVLIIWEWLTRKHHHGLVIDNFNVVIRWLIYLAISLSIIYYWGNEQEFIYFQF